jgi:hypothetical protein
METIQCECGWVVKGNSIKHAESNLKIHKTSRVHKIMIKNKKTAFDESQPSNKQNSSSTHKREEKTK